jgi:hypothetical protein
MSICVNENAQELKFYETLQMNDELMKRMKEKKCRFVTLPRSDEDPYKIFLPIEILKGNFNGEDFYKINAFKYNCRYDLDWFLLKPEQEIAVLFL